MSKYELSKTTEDCVSGKVNNWYEEAAKDLAGWYDTSLDNIDVEYNKQINKAVSDEEKEQAVSWRLNETNSLNLNYREKQRSLDMEKHFLDCFLYSKLFDRYYNDAHYFIDLKKHRIRENEGNEFYMEFSKFCYADTGTTLEISSLDESDVDEVEDANAYSMY